MAMRVVQVLSAATGAPSIVHHASFHLRGIQELPAHEWISPTRRYTRLTTKQVREA